MNEVQKECLYILKELHRICDIHNIKYSLSSGTLLGAIRHKGFIPWDDDLDVTMLRSDYEEFLKVVENDLGCDFFLQTSETEKNYFNNFAKIRSNRMDLIERPTKKHNINQGVWIDIFPMDDIPDSEMQREIQFNQIKKIDKITRFFAYVYPADNDKGVKKNIKSIIQNVNSLFLGQYKFLRTLSAKRNSIIQEFNGNNLEYVNMLSYPLMDIEYEKCIMNKEHLKDLILHDFEDSLFWIPKAYDEVLSNLYGAYMQLPPKNQRIGSHGILIDKE